MNKQSTTATDTNNSRITLSRPEFYSTAEFAELFGVKPQTVRKNLCLLGHSYSVRPVKNKSNRFLRWPKEETLKALYSNN